MENKAEKFLYIETKCGDIKLRITKKGSNLTLNPEKIYNFH